VTQILIIDDSEDDCLLIRHILAKGSENFSVHDVSGVQPAIDYLTDDGDEHPRPELILCDLIMPRQDGLSFLKWFRMQSELTSIKVAIMSGTYTEATIEEARAGGACACIDKGNLFRNPAPFYKAVQLCLSGEHAFVM